jgi:hypothetical protein
MGEGVVTARAVIVTASTAVLASGRIRFRPNLPGAYASAFEKLKLGSYDHVALAFNGNPLGLDANEVVFERVYTTKTAALLANVHGTRLSLLTLAGRSVVELANKGETAMTDFALDWISGVFGSRAKKAVSRVHATSWNKDPWTLGAFSSAPPGAQEARKTLSEPLNDVVWFAGEAVPSGAPSAERGRMASVPPMRSSRGSTISPRALLAVDKERSSLNPSGSSTLRGHPPRAGSKQIRRYDLSRSSPSPPLRWTERRRSRRRRGVMTMCQSPTARASSWRKSVNICPRPLIICCSARVCFGT